MQAGNTERSARADLLAVYRAAIAAGDAGRLTADYLRSTGPLFEGDGGVLLVGGAGKAAARMAEAVEREFSGRDLRGVVIVPEKPPFDLERIRVAVGRHPVPDRRGERATARLCSLLVAHPGVPLLFLLSGGASSLLVQPAPPVTLADKARVTELLLRSGADIGALNTVRKHLSTVKGGGLLRRGGPRAVLTLLISDVVGDDPSVIGSGPTTADPSTFAAAERALREHAILDQVPEVVRAALAAGSAGRVRETVKPGDRELEGTSSVVIGNNRVALAGAADEARRRGYAVLVEADPLVGDTRVAAGAWLDRVERYAATAAGKPWCVIAGGETTVRVRGGGRGGRNQEFALALVDRLAGRRCAVLSAGTDGIDGPTDAAGAFVDGRSAVRATAAGRAAARFLDDNDSYTYFAGLGDLLCCGPTGTNLMDIKIALGPAA